MAAHSIEYWQTCPEMTEECMHVEKGHPGKNFLPSSNINRSKTTDHTRCQTVQSSHASLLSCASGVSAHPMARQRLLLFGGSSAHRHSAVSTSERQPKLQQARTFAAPASQRAARELPRRGVSQSVGRTGRLEGSFRAARVEWPRGQGPRQSAPAAVRGTQRVGGGEYNVQAQDSGLGHYQMR